MYVLKKAPQAPAGGEKFWGYFRGGGIEGGNPDNMEADFRRKKTTMGVMIGGVIDRGRTRVMLEACPKSDATL